MSDTDRAYHALMAIRRSKDWCGVYTPGAFVTVRNDLGIGLDYVKRAALRIDLETDVDRAEDLEDIKRVLLDVIKRITR